MSTKLSINLRDGTLDVEGTEDFVRSIYEDFKEELARRADVPTPLEPSKIEVDREPAPSDAEPPKKARRSRRSGSNEGQKGRASAYKPTFDSGLNLADLGSFYQELRPNSNFEKILVFAAFLRDRLKTHPCTADQIYTCFFTLKDRTKIPEAFVQAFRDTQNRTHFIEMKSLQDISVTIRGNNHIEEMKKRKSDE
jgi:hypothetical protein